MKPYRIEGGRGKVPAGTVVGLTADQYRPRGHLLDLTGQEDGLFVGKAKEELVFKAGEAVRFDAEPPAKGWGKMFVPTTAKKAQEAEAQPAAAEPKK